MPVGQPYGIYSINIFKLKKNSIVVKKMNVYCSHVNNAYSFGGKITQPELEKSGFKYKFIFQNPRKNQ